MITVSGLAEVRAKLESLGTALNPTEILDEAEALLLNRVRTRFFQQIDPDGQPWAPLSIKYAKRKLAKWKAGGILFASGNLFHSIQAFADGPNERAIATDVPYAPFHQYGTKHMPRRAFLGFSDEDLYLTERLVVRRIEEALK